LLLAANRRGAGPVKILLVLAALGVAMVLSGPTAAQAPASARCGVFFAHWNVPGAPVGTATVAGMGHELAAARDCIAKDKKATACEHYRRLSEGLKRGAPALAAETGKDIAALMKEAACD
jgi:hypothetical protein